MSKRLTPPLLLRQSTPSTPLNHRRRTRPGPNRCLLRRAPRPFAADARHQAAPDPFPTPYARRPARSADPLEECSVRSGADSSGCSASGPLVCMHRVLVPIFHGAHSALGSGGWVVALVLALGLGVFVGVLLVRRRSHIASRPTNKRSRTTDEVPIDLELGGRGGGSERRERAGRPTPVPVRARSPRSRGRDLRSLHPRPASSCGGSFCPRSSTSLLPATSPSPTPRVASP